eukprot:TRINITY_DN17952_c1_g1_i1.p1 TRINITY_DN17952_c1_g1~~TRINITY_DN17952_c1_g1_i1.p1  ORF type:complete len:117 (+),score=8.30 TRINITY_DN17952_c1_g1_i1:224-574(+)
MPIEGCKVGEPLKQNPPQGDDLTRDGLVMSSLSWSWDPSAWSVMREQPNYLHIVPSGSAFKNPSHIHHQIISIIIIPITLIESPRQPVGLLHPSTTLFTTGSTYPRIGSTSSPLDH